MAKPPVGRLPHDKAVLLCALAGGAPAVAAALWLLWSRADDSGLAWLLSVLIVGCWLALALYARNQVVRPLQTMANLLLALREGDYSFRARGAGYEDSLSGALAEINSLGSVLQSQRRDAVEATALLRTVMAEIDVAVFAFDQEGVLRLVNRAGERLLAKPSESLVGRSAAGIGLAETLEGEPSRLLAAATIPGTHARWGLRRSQFREGGRPHQLVVIADLSQPLREEELKAWQRLVRVLGHELNNSLAPIKSIAGSLGAALRRSARPADWEADLRAGLDIIAARADGLGRFLQAYAQLARLPPPSFSPCDLAGLLRRVIALEARLAVDLAPGKALEVRCDSAQIEHALINLVRNAADAVLEQRAAGRAAAGVRVRLQRAGAMAEIRIEDDGPGLAQTTNLFVPFFTTKPEGSGIGLVLSRQIAENHGGSLELRNRTGGGGCEAVLRVPLSKG
jgi:nitrogen fixation/metabolism regulation signal transduction histidine kinase